MQRRTVVPALLVLFAIFMLLSATFRPAFSGGKRSTSLSPSHAELPRARANAAHPLPISSPRLHPANYLQDPGTLDINPILYRLPCGDWPNVQWEGFVEWSMGRMSYNSTR